MTGLSDDTNYTFRLRARNSLGYGVYSSEKSISTLMGYLGTAQGTWSDGTIEVNGKTIITLEQD